MIRVAFQFYHSAVAQEIQLRLSDQVKGWKQQYECKEEDAESRDLGGQLGRTWYLRYGG